jgi:hypothetical protein
VVASPESSYLGFSSCVFFSYSLLDPLPITCGNLERRILLSSARLRERSAIKNPRRQSRDKEKGNKKWHRLMDSTAELTGLVRRVSPRAYERLLLLFHCLLSCSGGGGSGNGTAAAEPREGASPTLSLPSITAVLLSACPGAAPRFLFALGANSTLLRSPDGGHTWRVSFARSCEDATPSHEGADSVDVVHDMQRLLTSAAALDAEMDEPDPVAAVTSSATRAPSYSESSTICSADGYDEVVALCGPDGFVAVSGDRGVTFTTISNCILADGSDTTTTATTSTSGATAAAVASPSTLLQHICVLDRQCLVVSDGYRVLRMSVSQVGYGRLSLGAATVVLTCVSAVVMVRAYSTAGGGRVVVVSESGKLHLSFDGAATFLEVRHCLGQIRDVSPMDALRRCEQPPFSFSAVAAALDVSDAPAPSTGGSGGTSSASSPYAYVSGYKRDTSSIADVEGRCDASHVTALMHFEAVARRHEPDVYYEHLFVSGTGAEVLPYDYTAVLCVCTRRTANPSDNGDGDSTSRQQQQPAVAWCTRVLSSASKVSYVVFSRTRRREALPCVITRCVSRSGIVAARGSSVGLSTSSDFVHWTTPQGPAPVGLTVMSGGEVLASGRLKVITTVGAPETARTMPHSLRVPFLVASFAM